jgi:hypothetical protein
MDDQLDLQGASNAMLDSRQLNKSHGGQTTSITGRQATLEHRSATLRICEPCNSAKLLAAEPQFREDTN